MLEFKKSEDSESHMAVLKGTEGLSVYVCMPYQTPFCISLSNSVKNLTHEESMKLRDYLNVEYPINYLDIIDVEFVDVETKGGK